MYHGTSTLFLRGILEHGLGGKNPIEEWRVLNFAQEILPLAERHPSHIKAFTLKIGSFKRMTEQFSEHWNFQHGDTYLSPSRSTAIRYASNNRYGSELLTYSLDFLRGLLDREVPGVDSEIFRRHPHIFHKLDVSPAPVLIEIDGIPKSALRSEHGEDPSTAIKELEMAMAKHPESIEDYCQQTNFRLRAPIPAERLKISLLVVTRWDPIFPEYDLYPIASKKT
jgi:hypothetical protein